jgi:hypothetical protein
MKQVLKVVLTAVAFVIVAAGAMSILWMSGDDGDYVLDEPIAVTVTIDYGDGTVETYEVLTVNATVYGALLDAAKPNVGDFSVISTYYSEWDSIFVETIGDRTNGDDGRFWIFYVNGEYAHKGASRTRLGDGDEISWRFESYG